MADRKSRHHELRRLDIICHEGTSAEKKYNIEALVMDFQYHESIESPFLRADFTIIDAVDFNLQLQGGEPILIELETESSKSKPLKVELQVYKIGSIIKQERQQMYILHCVSPEMYHNEIKRVFKAFGPGSKKDVNCVPKFIAKEYLNADPKKLKGSNFEDHSKFTFISPSWRPVDTITYLSDKVTRKVSKKSGASSKGSEKQSGFLFFENSDGFHFKSIDSLAEQDTNGFKYTYTQSGNMEDDKDGGQYVIESVQYPDKANHLQNMRMGTYKTSYISVSIPMPTESHLQDAGKTSGQQTTTTTQNTTTTAGSVSGTGSLPDDVSGVTKAGGTSTSPSGTIRPPKAMTFNKLFSMASTIESRPPLRVPKILGDLEAKTTPPTRTKFRALPGFKNQQSKASLLRSATTTTTSTTGFDTSSGASGSSSTSSSITQYFNSDNVNDVKPLGATAGKQENQSTSAVAHYAAARYNLMRAIQLNIVVPGNTGLKAGEIVTVVIPAAKEEGKNVQEDFRYSGKYLIAGVTHVWKPAGEGVTSRLSLIRDSTKKQG